MNKILAWTCVILLIASQCQGAWWVKLGGAAAGGEGEPTCDTGTSVISQLSATSAAGTNGYSIGQSFTVSSSFYLYSITIRVNNDAASGNLTVRWGTSTDLSGTCGIGNNCIEEVTVATPNYPGGGQIYEFVMSTVNELTAGVYYLQVAGSTNYDISRESTSSYTGGDYYYGTAGTWIATSVVSGRDMYFVVKSCD